jgi:hypothetical protein
MNAIICGLILVAACEGFAIWLLDKRREARIDAKTNCTLEEDGR